MSTFLLRVEAIEARVASYSCPRGTAGRVHTLRLRRHFQPPSRPQSTAIGEFSDWDISHNGSSRNTHDIGLRCEPSQQPTGGAEQSGSLQRPRQASNLSCTVRVAPEDITSIIKDVMGTAASNMEIQGRGRIPKPHPTHMAKAYYGDTFGLPFPERQYHPRPNNLNGDHLDKALQSGKPHAILTALVRLIRVGEDGYQGHRILDSLPANTFSEVLRCLNPQHFVGRYINLHKEIGPKNSPYLALQSHRENGLYQFCVDFIARIRSIIEARRAGGFVLSLFDYKYLLRCARAVGNPRASHAVWNAMERDGVTPDTECYNHYLAAKVWSDVLNSTKRYKVRVLPKQWKVQPPAFQGYQVGIKYQTTKTFDKMVQNGVVGDEETFCLLMVALAREGDVEGMKGILDKVWGIDVDVLMTKNESGPGPAKHFPVDSPFRPTKTLLFALAHAFGINNSIPVALRLVDYVSRKYSITIPTEVWEELLERTFVLCTPRTLKQKEAGLNIGQLPPEAVSNLWAALVAEPYSVKPTMAMYDKLIVNLLKRQRFGEVQHRIEEGLQLHIKAVRRYSRTLALIERQSSLSEIEGENPSANSVRSSKASQHSLDLQRDQTFQHLCVHRSRQYLRRWCRLFIRLGTRSLRYNPAFSAVTLPEFMQKYLTFMPRHLEYPTATGVVRFWSGSVNLNKARARAFAAQKLWPSKKTAMTNRLTLPRAAAKPHEKASLDLLPPSEEMFGKS